jgi:hypothetical protein
MWTVIHIAPSKNSAETIKKVLEGEGHYSRRLGAVRQWSGHMEGIIGAGIAGLFGIYTGVSPHCVTEFLQNDYG